MIAAPLASARDRNFPFAVARKRIGVPSFPPFTGRNQMPCLVFARWGVGGIRNVRAGRIYEALEYDGFDAARLAAELSMTGHAGGFTLQYVGAFASP